MASARYNRFVVRSFNAVGKTIIAVACLMWLIPLADLLLDLGWGWDKQGLWIGPNFVIMGTVVLIGGNAIFRLLGAAPTK
jgi:hypothetical protein